MSELEKIDNVEVIPTDNTTGEVSGEVSGEVIEPEVIEVPEDNSNSDKSLFN